MDRVRKMMLVPYSKQTKTTPAQEKTIITASHPEGEHQTVNPLSEKLLVLDNAMEKILSDETLPDFEKVKEYTKAMQSYMEYRRKYSGPTQLAPIGTIGGAHDGELIKGSETVTFGTVDSKKGEEGKNVTTESDKEKPIITDVTSDNITDIIKETPPTSDNKAGTIKGTKNKLTRLTIVPHYDFDKRWLSW
jgi:hypothetical protein